MARSRSTTSPKTASVWRRKRRTALQKHGWILATARGLVVCHYTFGIVVMS
jgi:hypothetical protein